MENQDDQGPIEKSPQETIQETQISSKGTHGREVGWGPGKHGLSNGGSTVRLEQRYIKRKLTEEEELFLSAEPDQQTIQQQRAEKFMKHFVATKGNATKAAMQAFGILNRAVASKLGSFYIRKIREIGRVYLEDQGITYGTLITSILEKSKTEKDPEYMRMLARVMGPEISEIIEPPAKNTNQNVNVNILQEHRKTQDEFGFGDVAEGEIIENEEV